VKAIPGFSVSVVFAALLCFAPSTLGQTTIHNKVTSAASDVLLYAPSGFLVFRSAPDGDHRRGGNGGGGNGCGGNGGGDERFSDQGGGNKCEQVPEGGSALMYLLLAGLCCMGGVWLRFRRQIDLRANN